MLQADSVGRWLLRLSGAAGFAVFACFLALTFHTPQWVESFAKEFIEREVTGLVDTKIEAIGAPRGESLAARLTAEVYERNARQIEELRARLKDRSRDVFRVALDQVRDVGCECRRRMEEAWHAMNVAALARLVTDNERIMGFIQHGYMQVVHELRLEIRIFTATNAFCFLLLMLVSFAKPAATRHLLYPGVLLLCATMFCACLYTFEQDWLLTIIHGSYVGWAYAAYLGITLLFLCDIAFNRGRVTTNIGNSLAESLGAVASLAPC
jgi:hypothetical protein